MKNKGFLSFIIFYIIVSALLLFYLDLANGPIYLLFVEISVLVSALMLRIVFKDKTKFIKSLAFLSIIVLNIPIIILAHPSVEAFKPVEKIVETDVLHLKNGDVIGTYNEDRSVEIYAGVPYAKAPVGNLRFKEPQEVEDWTGILNCTYFKPRAMQVDTAPVMSTLINMYAEGSWHPNYNMEPIQEMSEDCLYLNIWRPSGNKTNLPILVYIHGGSLKSGSSSSYEYNGETYAKKDVIMITIAYRLGIFGYFTHPSLALESIHSSAGNYGLLDQIQALKWINDNAIYFGGDKDNITIAGESAGSSSVSALCSSPLAKNLFKKAIAESSSLVVEVPPHTYLPYSDAILDGEKIMEEFGCSTIDELRNISAEELVKSKTAITYMTIDGYALTKTPYEVYKSGENNEVALLNGYNIKESDAFVIPTYLFSPTNKHNIKERLFLYFGEDVGNDIYNLYKDRIEEDAFSVFNEIMSVHWFIYPHYVWSTLAKENGVKVYKYQFTKENGYYGTYHSGEIIYFYGNLANSPHTFAYDESDFELEKIINKFLINFIKNGDPNGEGLPLWEEYRVEDNRVMELGNNVSMINDRYLDLYPLIKSYIDNLE